MKLTRHDDPENCQTQPRLGYEEFFVDCERREASGQKQTCCATCKRWRWEDQQCARFVAESPQPTEE